MINMMLSLLGIGTQDQRKRIQNRINMLREKKESQARALEEITRLTMDGEDEWLLKIVRKEMKEDATCAGAVLDNCVRGKQHGMR